MKYRILSIAGGGVGGVASLYAINQINKNNVAEWQKQNRTDDFFDCFCGTSVGAIIAGMLASGMSTNDAFIVLETGLKEAFTPYSWYSRTFKDKPKYKNSGLRKLLEKYLGKDTRMCDLKHPCYIVSYQTTGNQRFKVFGPDSKELVVDAIMASAAAPTYFPAIWINGKQYCDGGLINNLPTDVAILGEIARKGINRRDIYAMSVLTGGESRKIGSKGGFTSGSTLSFIKKVPKTIINGNIERSIWNAEHAIPSVNHFELSPEFLDFELDDLKCVSRLKREWDDELKSSTTKHHLRGWFSIAS